MSRIKCRKWSAIAGITALAGLLASCGDSTVGNASAHAYVATEGTLATYTIDSSTGSLTAVGGSSLTFPVSFPFGGIQQVLSDPSGRYLYVLHSSGIHVYSINRDTGALTELPGSPFGAGGGPNSLAFDASGNHLYLAGPSSPAAPVSLLISAYSVDGASGVAPIATYTLQGELASLAAAGNYLYVANLQANSIAVFSIAPSGELTQDVPGSPFATDTGPYDIVVDPTGSVLYTANDGMPTNTQATPGSISAFTINSSTGALTAVAGDPLPIAVAGPLSTDAMGRFLFVPEVNGVSVYTIDSTSGALAVVAGSPFSAGTNPGLVSIDPVNQMAYVVNRGSADVSEFMLSNTGTLTPLAGSPLSVASDPVSITIVQ